MYKIAGTWSSITNKFLKGSVLLILEIFGDVGGDRYCSLPGKVQAQENCAI